MTTIAPGPSFRAEHIGSLLRPPALLAARDAFEAGTIDREALRAAEDEAIRGAVALQEEVGLEAVTDGEFRRHTYSDSFTTSGISGIAIATTEDEGWRKSSTHGHRMARRIPQVVAKIEWQGAGNARDFAFLKSVTRRTPKITLPGPAYIHYRTGREHIARDVIPTSTLSGPTWSRPIAARCARSAMRAAPICRSTRPRSSSSAMPAHANCCASAATIGRTCCASMST